VETLVGFITNANNSVECISIALEAAPVPWSHRMKQLCRLGQGLKATNAERIKEQETLVSLKEILKRYNCSSLTIQGRKLERLIQLMARRAGEEGYQDALKVSVVLYLQLCTTVVLFLDC